MAELTTIIFDVDGTLADTGRDGHRVAFNLAFTEAGLDWNWNEELYGQLSKVSGGNEDFTGASLVVDNLGEPGHICTALSGNLQGHAWVDIAPLKKLHKKQHG